MANDRAQNLSQVRRVVIKVGSSLVTDEARKSVRKSFLRSLAAETLALQAQGIQCLIVTSGAIAAGLFELGWAKRPKEMAKLQALAAVGQSSLMHAYEQTFKKSGLKVAQILLTRDDLSNRNRYSNAHNTLMELLQDKIVPIVNENDTVAVEEIKFGNNDLLGVLVTHLAEADLLVILTDTEGFYDRDPKLNPKAKLIPEVFEVDAALEKKATASGTAIGTGGMISKVRAARSMMQSGLPMVIANGRKKNVLRGILKGQVIGTFFHPSGGRMNSRKRWLAWSVKSKGEILVDEGARKALVEGDKSLLPSGIKQITGSWRAGDTVRVRDLEGRILAKGIVNYSSEELEKIKGLRTSEVSAKLGRAFKDEVIHRDNIVKMDLMAQEPE